MGGRCRVSQQNTSAHKGTNEIAIILKGETQLASAWQVDNDDDQDDAIRIQLHIHNCTYSCIFRYTRQLGVFANFHVNLFAKDDHDLL
ncbi:unnamed protein product [Dovyalis caffra]|uniref:Uncharacterized protein n=1 Tax=Dovyalis caffra TaxID=77055 RepID=A0AAV1R0P1_9ROSI|nr:unnamed protein product [Dovyalis caffra]